MRKCSAPARVHSTGSSHHLAEFFSVFVFLFNAMLYKAFPHCSNNYFKRNRTDWTIPERPEEVGRCLPLPPAEWIPRAHCRAGSRRCNPRCPCCAQLLSQITVAQPSNVSAAAAAPTSTAPPYDPHHWVNSRVQPAEEAETSRHMDPPAGVARNWCLSWTWALGLFLHNLQE